MKKITVVSLLAVLLLSAVNSIAQFATVWNAPYQHSTTLGHANQGKKMVMDPSGNIFVLSDLTSDIDPQGIQGGLYHYVNLNKYSGNGVLLETVNVEVTDHVVIGNALINSFGIEVDAAGDIYIGYADYFTTSNFNICIDKFDNDLTLIWHNTHAMFGTGGGVDMKLHPSGTVYAIVQAGFLSSVYSLIKSVPTNAAAVSVISFFLPTAPVINSLALDGVQTAYVGGYVMKGGSKNIYIGAVNLSTNAMDWANGFSFSGAGYDEELNEITIGADGNIYSVGSFSQAGADYAPLVMKILSSNSRVEFARIMRAGPNVQGLFINASESGWVYMGAASSGEINLYRFPDDGSFTNPGYIEYYPEPSGSHTGVNSITLHAMRVSSNKNLYITGGINATDLQGDFNSFYVYKTSVVFGNALIPDGSLIGGTYNASLEGVDLVLDYSKTDVYCLNNFSNAAYDEQRVELLDINVPSPLKFSAELVSDGISLSPNPATGTVRFNSEVPITSIEVVDLTGNQVVQIFSDDTRVTINTASFSPGIYLCKVQTRTSGFNKKLVISK